MRHLNALGGHDGRALLSGEGSLYRTGEVT